MSDAGRLAAFGVVLAAALGLGFGVGVLVGPVDTGQPAGVVQENVPASGDQSVMDPEAGQ